MKVIIAGSRNLCEMEYVNEAVRLSRFCVSEVVSGTARGVDLLGEEWAEFIGFPIKRFPADWDTHGKRAGYLRNQEMAHYADALVAIWDGYSKGTKHMIDLGFYHGLQVFVYKVEAGGLKISTETNVSRQKRLDTETGSSEDRDTDKEV